MAPDAYFDSFEDALSEILRRRLNDAAEGMISRISPSPYGGFRVRSIPADFLVDSLAESICAVEGSDVFRDKKVAY